MRLLSQFARVAFDDPQLAESATKLAGEVQVGIERYGKVWSPQHGGWMYVYETDGNGNNNLMDDANLPNLTGLPYIGFCSTDDPIYLNTRKFTLSSTTHTTSAANTRPVWEARTRQKAGSGRSA